MVSKKIRMIILLLLSPILLFGLYVVGVLVYGSFHDWKPEEKINIQIEPLKKGNDVLSDSIYSFMIWNIGYGGLGESADFFYDGGNMVRSSKEDVDKYLKGITKTIQEHQNTDFILLQEVDKHSKRSYYLNEFDLLHKETNSYYGSFALNFNVPFVPKKYFDPIGHVESGLASFSKYQATSATRFQYPGEFSWPLRLFNLDRCFLSSRYHLQNGKELIIINTHNSAYDDGTMKKQEMDYLKNYLNKEYNKGNYVIVGGDWNQCPPGFQWDTFAKMPETEDLPITIQSDFMAEGWTWVFDAKIASNRKLKEKFDVQKTFTTIIDFYLVSPNVEALEVNGLSQKFNYSDHQPVFMKCRLK